MTLNRGDWFLISTQTHCSEKITSTACSEKAKAYAEKLQGTSLTWRVPCLRRLSSWPLSVSREWSAMKTQMSLSIALMLMSCSAKSRTAGVPCQITTILLYLKSTMQSYRLQGILRDGQICGGEENLSKFSQKSKWFLLILHRFCQISRHRRPHFSDSILHDESTN